MPFGGCKTKACTLEWSLHYYICNIYNVHNGAGKRKKLLTSYLWYSIDSFWTPCMKIFNTQKELSWTKNVLARLGDYRTWQSGLTRRFLHFLRHAINASERAGALIFSPHTQPSISHSSTVVYARVSKKNSPEIRHREGLAQLQDLKLQQHRKQPHH